MTKPIIHFAHANGFPALTYRKIFLSLEPRFQVNYIERHAHDASFPVTDNWTLLKDELRTRIEDGFTEKITGIGHSLGGVLHLLVAAEKPELYKQIILLDAPIISRLSSFGLYFLKRTNLIDGYTPSRVTKIRRNLLDDARRSVRTFSPQGKIRRVRRRSAARLRSIRHCRNLARL